MIAPVPQTEQRHRSANGLAALAPQSQLVSGCFAMAFSFKTNGYSRSQSRAMALDVTARALIARLIVEQSIGTALHRLFCSPHVQGLIQRLMEKPGPQRTRGRAIGEDLPAAPPERASTGAPRRKAGFFFSRTRRTAQPRRARPGAS